MANVIIGYSCCPLTRSAFQANGHNAFTCDLLPSRGDQKDHYMMDVWDLINDGARWHFGVFHPMCTYLTVSAAWAFNDPDFSKYPGVGYHQRVAKGTLVGKARRDARDAAINEFERLMDLPFPAIIENPASNFVSKVVGSPRQVLQPYNYGHDASKATGIWHNRVAVEMNLPLLRPAGLPVLPRYVNGRPRWGNQTDSGQNRLSPSDDRWLERSKTYPGIASAIGTQYGEWLNGK